MYTLPLELNWERLPRNIITIGASAGGIEALKVIFAQLPEDLPAAIAVVVHRHPTLVGHLAEVLGRNALIPVAEVNDGDPLETGRVYLAPPDMHLLIEDGRVRLDRTPKVLFNRPAVDPLFQSAAAAYGVRVVGVLLSGAGRDGTSGSIAIHVAGGISIVQDPVEAEHPSMPTHAIQYGHVDAILPLERIASTLVALAAGELAPSSLPSSR